MGFFDWLDSEVEEQQIEMQEEKHADFSNFNKVTDYLYEHSGITDLHKRALMASRFQQKALEMGIYTSDDFVSALKNNTDFYHEIINIATVNETYFLREIKELEWLINYIKQENRPLKILCIPSSSGEEIYSILLMMKHNNLDIDNINITGYDINSYAIKNAQDGVFDQHSLHKIDSDMMQKYFIKKENNRYQISPTLKNSVNFIQKNIFDLTDDKNQYDIILSRNMFIYFDEVNRLKALNIIVKLLKTDGIYIKGHADHIKPHSQLINIAFGVYKKNLI